MKTGTVSTIVLAILVIVAILAVSRCPDPPHHPFPNDPKAYGISAPKPWSVTKQKINGCTQEATQYYGFLEIRPCV
jgi:hypothetical protein